MKTKLFILFTLLFAFLSPLSQNVVRAQPPRPRLVPPRLPEPPRIATPFDDFGARNIKKNLEKLDKSEREKVSEKLSDNVLIALGRLEYSQGDLETAMIYLEKLAQRDSAELSDEAALYAGCARVFARSPLAKEDYEKAREYFEKLVKRGKDARFSREALFYSLFASYLFGDYEAAKKNAKDFLSLYPDDAFTKYVYHVLGIAFGTTGDFKKGIEYFDLALTKFPASPVHNEDRLGKCALLLSSDPRSKQAQKALEELKNANDPDPLKKTKIATAIASAALVAKRPQDALDALEKNVPQIGSEWDGAREVLRARLLQAAICLALDKKERAEEAIGAVSNSALDKDRDAAFMKIDILIGLERFDDASASIVSLVNASFARQTRERADMRRAAIALAQGRCDEAIDIASNALRVASVKEPLGYLDLANEERANDRDAFNAYGTLLLAYASRFALKSEKEDDDARKELLQALRKRAEERPDEFGALFSEIDKRQKAALKTAIAKGSEVYFFPTPKIGSLLDLAKTEGTFKDPFDPESFERGAVKKEEEDQTASLKASRALGAREIDGERRSIRLRAPSLDEPTIAIEKEEVEEEEEKIAQNDKKEEKQKRSRASKVKKENEEKENERKDVVQEPIPRRKIRKRRDMALEGEKYEDVPILVKNSLFVNILLERFDEVEKELEELKKADRTKGVDDSIEYYRAAIALAKGDWDDAEKILVKLLDVQKTNAGVAFGYYPKDFDFDSDESAPLKMPPEVFLKACGILVLTVASRAGANDDENDRKTQEEYYQATMNVTEELFPDLNYVVSGLRFTRERALKKPIRSGKNLPPL